MQQQSRRPVSQIGPMQTTRVRPSPYPTYQYQPVSSETNSVSHRHDQRETARPSMFF